MATPSNTRRETLATPDSPVGKLAAQLPGASRVFMRHNIDFCCAGKRTLGEACEDRALDATNIIEEIARESAAANDDASRWENRSLAELVGHIVADYHEPLRVELARLQGMADKVLRVHGERDPQRLSALAETLRTLGEELVEHMDKEERVLFPWILSGRGELAVRPVHAMLLEHDDAGRLLDTIGELTDDFVAPRGACATWRALWAGLEQLDESLRVHIHLENNVLFPRTLAGEAPTA